MTFDPTVLVNFIFAVLILILGFWVYRLKKMMLALYVAFGFALFAISHLAILLGTPSSDISIIIIRSLGYLVVIYGLAREAWRK